MAMASGQVATVPLTPGIWRVGSAMIWQNTQSVVSVIGPPRCRRCRADGRARIDVELDMRYRGQAYELPVPLRGRPATAGALREAERAFHASHRKAYGHERPVDETEIVTLRVRATG